MFGKTFLPNTDPSVAIQNELFKTPLDTSVRQVGWAYHSVRVNSCVE